MSRNTGLQVWEPLRREQDAADRWLRANDPRLRAEGIAVELVAALEREGLSLDEARGAFPKGRPSKAVQALRARVRDVLLPMWDDDWRRDFLAQALGCDRVTLWRLMA